MKILVKNATVTDPASPFNGKKTDILIENGTIIQMGSITANDAQVITSEDLHAAPGFMDLQAHLCDPGYEYKETLESGSAAALKGGFTAVLAMPDTQPPVQTKAEVEYIRKRAEHLPVHIYPAGAMSVDLQGKDMAELFDMHQAGAKAFTDARNISDSGLLVRSLMYAHNFGGRIHVKNNDKHISHGGQMNEGPMSTSLGLKGMPGLAEELMVARNIYLAEYAGTPIHLMCISTKKSVELVREAKQKKLPVSAAVHAYNLFWNDNVLEDFDTNYKVNPPLRSEDDRLALLAGVADGTIDCITSGHKPEDTENKVVEFDLAAFGMIGLESAFAIANTACSLTPEQLVKAFSLHPRMIAGVHTPTIKEGQPAEITLFDPTMKWTFSASDISSKSRNTPLIGIELKGKVVGVVCKGGLKVL
ncbi:MAG: dihydroorotase [Bacteroidia bacterium]